MALCVEKEAPNGKNSSRLFQFLVALSLDATQQEETCAIHSNFQTTTLLLDEVASLDLQRELSLFVCIEFDVDQELWQKNIRKNLHTKQAKQFCKSYETAEINIERKPQNNLLCMTEWNLESRSLLDNAKQFLFSTQHKNDRLVKLILSDFTPPSKLKPKRLSSVGRSRHNETSCL
ncbi:CLUMA_CG013766, isoform A [Clunio marinus]|uniref:CLUMA_CG013766, isoform A n=1 Tax=Clunio marinus TaxID=568069 RepID=A0A1J1IPS6_9DIPT|nr:CLUMA_CG013766, isoform A [Clunio marinus]